MRGLDRTATVEPTQCLACGVRISWLNLGINLALALVKCVVGIFANSRALVACALYSVNDALSAAVVLVTMRVARKPPDEDHPYGHGKAEFIAIGIVSLVLVVSVVFYLVYVLVDMVRGTSTSPHVVALLVAVATGATNYYLSRWETCAASHLASPALHTAAEHNKSDAVSSGLAIVGIGGAMVGLRFLDPLVAVVEIIDVIRLSGSMLGSTLRELMDFSLSPEQLERAATACRKVPGVIGMTQLRSRQAGSQRWVDVEVIIARGLSVGEANEITSRVRSAIDTALGRNVQVQVKYRTEGAVLVLDPPRGTVVQDG